MPAAVVSISDFQRADCESARTRRAHWWMLEIAPVSFGGTPEAGHRIPTAVPFGILFVDAESDRLTLRCRPAAELEGLSREGLAEQELDILDFLAEDLREKSRESGGVSLLDSLEDSLSHFLRIGDRTSIAYSGSPQRETDRLFDEHVDGKVRPYVTHLPLYSLRAAATKFGEDLAGDVAGDVEAWLRPPENMRLTEGMFAVRVTGRSMEPLIPDGSLCVFRGNVAGTRQGRFLLIEKFGESDFAARYTVKRYTSAKTGRAAGGWEHTQVRLEPLNPEFQAFDLGPEGFRVIAEFVAVLGD